MCWLALELSEFRHQSCGTLSVVVGSRPYACVRPDSRDGLHQSPQRVAACSVQRAAARAWRATRESRTRTSPQSPRSTTSTQARERERGPAQCTVVQIQTRREPADDIRAQPLRPFRGSALLQCEWSSLASQLCVSCVQLCVSCVLG